LNTIILISIFNNVLQVLTISLPSETLTKKICFNINQAKKYVIIPFCLHQYHMD